MNKNENMRHSSNFSSKKQQSKQEKWYLPGQKSTGVLIRNLEDQTFF